MTEHLAAGLAAIERRVRRAVAARRANDPTPDDPYRGLYLTPEAVEAILEDPARIPAPDPIGGDQPVLPELADAFGLTALDVEILLIALAPDLDARFERLYGYLNDDVTRRRPTIGLALELCGVPPYSPAGRARFAAVEPLCASGLLVVAEPERPLLSRTVRVPDRVTAHLLGDPAPDPLLRGAARIATGEVTAARAGQVARAIEAGVRLLHLRQLGGASGADLARAALAETGRSAVLVELPALAEAEEPRAVLTAIGREAGLRGAGVVAGPVEALADPRQRGVLRALTGLATRVPVLCYGDRPWHPDWPGGSPPHLTTEPAATTDRARTWREAVRETGFPVSELDTSEAEAALAPYTLTPAQLAGSARAAAGFAVLDGGTLTVEHLRAGVRAQNGAGLARLARRIEPAVGWPDLVLPGEHLDQLRELVLRARHRDRVLGRWRMRPGGGRGTGVLALFAGESGTGKTMSAEVVAAELGLDLYVVDLATVVDKYIGETEKNLDRIFTEAAGVNGLLLFDEADALFGKRTEVKDSHDRNANLESAFLLQRMESFDGIAVLTTNLRSNLDEAFTRRLDVVVDFPVPDADQRLALWDRCLGPELPRSSDVDLAFCAKSFELAGGSIRACAVTAAYLAAEADRPVAMADLIAAVRREYRKLGRLLLDSEFGDWLEG
ncbi:ATP-binding protein [Amycolatopsis anabasis]|uniref:ATP-binding protein n=1 Tax=Amycolatopsis anabasis TaxID=1840409 RepID=UPI00131AD870|nr:ATP-binding protein [Amycolatopsis anabasis]